MNVKKVRVKKSLYGSLFALFATVCTTTVLMVSSPSQAQGSLQGAQLVKATVERAKRVVDRAVSAASRGRLECDSLALPIFVEASSSLGLAGDRINDAIAAYLAGNFAQFNFNFSVACSKGGIGRSQIARANLSTVLPPVYCPGDPKILTTFGPEIQDVIDALQKLRQPLAAGGAGCP